MPNSQKKKAPAPDKTVLTAQIIRDDFERFLSYMPNPDSVAAGSRASYDTYREMYTDPRIKSLLNKLKTAALNFPIRIVQGEGVKAEVYDFVRRQPIFGITKLYQKAKRMLSGLNYGFSVTEAVWREEDGAMLLDNLITRKPERFEFDHDWNCYWKRAGERRPLDDANKWLFFRHDPDDENPYGTSVLRCVYWAWLFKKAGYEFWLMATEKFSVKTIVALFEMTGGEDAVRERARTLADLLRSVESGSGTALANVKDLKEIGLDGHVSEFQSLVDACDVQIAYGLTGQAVATNNPENGNRSLGGVAIELLYDDAKGIALELQGVLQKAVDWAVELYFGKDAVPPQIEFDIDRKASFEDVMEAVDREIPVSKSDLYSYYKLPEPKNEADAFVRSDAAEVQPEGVPNQPASTPADVQATALNGAQVTSLLELAAKVAERVIPIDSAKAIARASFPLVKQETIDAMFDPLKELSLSDSSGARKKKRSMILIR